MPNRYANLTPSAKISQEYTKITEGFDKVQSEFDQMVALIDAIQSGDSGAAANAARYNSITGITYATLKQRLDVEYGEVTSQISQKASKEELNAVVNNRRDNLISEGEGIDPLALTFDVVNINRTQHMTIPVYDNDFAVNPDNAYTSEFESYATNTQVKYTWEKGRLSFDNAPGTIYDTAELKIKTPVSFKTGSFVCEMDVLEHHEATDGTGVGASVGVMKDNDNWCMANYDRYAMKMQIAYKVNGTLYHTDFTYQSLTPPYTMMMIVSNDLVTMAVKKDGYIDFIGEAYVGLRMSFNNPDVLNNWRLACGFRGAYNAPPLVITGLRGSYSSGMCVGADFHVLTYEDGCPIKNGNAIYFTASIHNTNAIGGACGVNIYKLGLNSYTLELKGQIHYKSIESGWYFGGASSKIFYDRRHRHWVCQVSNFKQSLTRTFIGTTKVNLLSGIHVIDLQPMDLPDVTVPTWDFDIIYDESVGKYRAVYSEGVGGGLFLCEADDVLGTWTRVASNPTLGGEGGMFFRCNGKYYISKTNADDLGLDIISYPDLARLGVTQVNKWSNKPGNKPHTWGQIVTLNNGDKTNFYMLIFSGNKWGGNMYGYGDLWIYKAREQENGLEFAEDNVITF